MKAQDAIEFIHKTEIPIGRKITYTNFVCNYRPLKFEPYRVRITVGGDKLDYPYTTASPAASIIEAKLIVNSVISDHKKHKSRFCAIDLNNFFLATPMERAEYIRIHKKHITKNFMQEYKLQNKITKDEYLYCKVKKGMYGFKQAAAILAYKLLVKRLEQDDYIPIPLTNGLFKHRTCRTTFALCVDNFGVKYNSEEDLIHLIQMLKKNYDILIDRTGKNYCGLTFEWHYKEGFVDVSMPMYVQKALKKFLHPTPQRPQYAPH